VDRWAVVTRPFAIEAPAAAGPPNTSARPCVQHELPPAIDNGVTRRGGFAVRRHPEPTTTPRTYFAYNSGLVVHVSARQHGV